MVYRDDDALRTLKLRTKEAIAMAMESRWEEAAALNRELLEHSPDDLDACNRLGKALLELGDAKGARGAFERSLTIDLENTIARKNLDRLAGSAAQPSGNGGGQMVAKLFIGDPGKSAQVALMACAMDSDRPFVSPGAPVELRPQTGTLAAYSTAGQYIGLVPPKLGRRLVCMMQAGNRYEGAVSGSSADGVRVMLQESFQHTSQRSKVSFPSAAVAEPAPAPRTVARPVERPVDLTWLERDGEDGSPERTHVGVGALLDGGLPDGPLFPE